MEKKGGRIGSQGVPCDISGRIRKLREQKSFTQRQLAERMGYSVDWVKKIEKNRRNISYENLIRFKNFFKVSYDYLIDGKVQDCADNSMDKIRELFYQLSKEERVEFAEEIFGDFIRQYLNQQD